MQTTEKQCIRKLIRRFLLTKLSNEEKERQSRLVTTHLFNRLTTPSSSHLQLNNKKHIAIYVSQNELEINTHELIKSLLIKTTKSIYIPYIDYETLNKQIINSNEMKFYKINSLHDYEHELSDANKFKIKQFKTIENRVELDMNLIDLLIVPGLAFAYDSQKCLYTRLGRGKGFYDAYINKILSSKTANKNLYSIGLAFNEQFIPNKHINHNLPFDSTHDRYLNHVIYENSILKI